MLSSLNFNGPVEIIDLSDKGSSVLRQLEIVDLSRGEINKQLIDMGSVDSFDQSSIERRDEDPFFWVMCSRMGVLSKIYWRPIGWFQKAEGARESAFN